MVRKTAKLARPEGIEPPTSCLEGSCSIQLSYGRICDRGRGGEGGIRTPGRLPVSGFQDRRNRPLCHLSGVTGRSNLENVVRKQESNTLPRIKQLQAFQLASETITAADTLNPTPLFS